MRLEDYEKKVFDEFLGLYKSGEVDQVPEDHFSDCLNIDFDVGEWFTRNGLTTAINLGYGAGTGKVRRFVAFGDLVIGPLILILDDVGNLYTFSIRTGDTATTPRITEALATDFSAIKFLGKIYIAFHDGEFGLYGKNLKIFIPHPTDPALDEFRNAAGLAPVAAVPMQAANNAEVFMLLGEDGSDLLGEDGSELSGEGGTGSVNAGTYLIAVAYETTSGFITPPGPKIGGVFTPTSIVIVSDNGRIDLSFIPIGPAGTSKRRILVTQAGLGEYFFLGSAFGGLINDNISTTTSLNFDDITDLVDSADYLFDLLETIPAPLGLAEYGARLCTFGAGDNPSIIRASKVGEGEAFDSIDGIVVVNKDDGFSLRNAIVIRNVMYACKNLGIFSVRDSGDVPSTWPVDPIDKSINTSIHGIGEFFDLAGINMARDWTLIADRSGILLFDGVARKPPITDKIVDVWQTMNWAKYHRLVIAVDEQLHKIYCAFPTGSSTENNQIIMGDYNKCPGKIPESTQIKWTPWVFRPGNTTKSPSDIGLFGVSGIDTVPTLKMGSMDGGGRIWKLDPASTDDNLSGLDSTFNDNFNRANGKVYTGNNNWSPDATHNAQFDILGNQVKITGNTGANPLVLNNNLFTQIGDQFSELTFVGVGSSLYQGGVSVRSFGSVFPFDRGYGLTLDNNHGTTKGVSVYRYFQSGPNYIFSLVFGGTLPTIIAPGDTLGLRMVGTTLYIIHNGVIIASATDVTYATGMGGMIQGGGFPSSSTWDNFRYGPYPEPVKGDIESYIETSLLYWEPGNVHFFTASRLRIIGSGTLLITIRGEDNILPANLPSLTLASAPGKEFLVRFNFQNEKARLKYRLTTGKFTFSKVEVFGKPVYQMRPA